LKKGLEVKSRASKYGLKSREWPLAKLRYETITDELIARHFFINRMEELETVAEFLGFYVRERNEVFHIPVIGATGIGKTALLHAIEFALSKLDTPLKFKYYDASSFSEQDEEEEAQLFFRYLEEVRSENYDVLLVDACEKDRSIDYSIREFFRAAKRFVLITSWEPQFWYVLKDRIEEIVPTAKQLFLKPFSREETKQLLEKVLWVVSEGKTELPEELLMKISELSEGIPEGSYTFIPEILLRGHLFPKKNGVDTESVLKAAGSLGILGLNERLEKLTDVHETIIRLILQSTDPRGIRPTELVEKLNKDKATVSYHLNYLLSENLLSVRRLGRYAFYQVREELKPFIQLKIIQEADFLA